MLIFFLVTFSVLIGSVTDVLQNMKSDSMSVEELEVTRMIRECLDLREKYVFRENVDPWTKSTEKTGLPEANNDPFNFVPVEASSVSSPSLLSFFQKLSCLKHFTICQLIYMVQFLWASSISSGWKMV